MSETEITTLQNIKSAAKNEFLKKGFRGASLRNIVKTANVTTGAFYGYFNSKDELFDALVGVQAEHIMSLYKNAQNIFAKLPPEEQLTHMGEISSDCMDEILDYAYDNLDECKLILCCSEGTIYESFIHDMVDIEVEATHKFADVLKSLGRTGRILNPQLEHMLISGMLSAFFEMIIHEMPKNQAKQNLRDLHIFYTAGWQKIMGF